MQGCHWPVMNPAIKIGIGTRSSLTCEEKKFNEHEITKYHFFDVAFNNSALLFKMHRFMLFHFYFLF